MLLYALLLRMARLALRWYYREIQMIGAEHVPMGVPMLVVANHPNALMDPMLVATTMPRRLTFTGKATLFDKPLLPLFLRHVGVVPLRRASDEAARRAAGGAADPGRNLEAFRAIVAALAADSAVLIFPEGKSHDEPGMSPLKTGAARIALQAMDAGVRNLVVLPVGLVFEDKAEPRTRVLVEVGNPLDLSTWRPPPSGGAAEALTAEIDRRLREVTINFGTVEQAGEVVSVSRLLADSGDTVETLGGGTPFSETVSLTRRADMVRRSLAGADTTLVERADALRERVRAIRETAGRHGVLLADVGIDTGAGAAATFVLRETAIAVTAGPLALWGRVTHWLPLRIARAIARRGSSSGADPAMYTVVSGLVFVLAFYVASGMLVWHYAGPWWALAFLVSLPASASWDFRLRDRARRARQRIRAFLRFRREPGLQRELRAELKAARDEAAALEHAVHSDAVSRA
jgi:glycerol-3-phosphate O-acyltransferase/dihydroxyacetone phosphate acyltransferase